MGLLLVSACGARLTDEQYAALQEGPGAIAGSNTGVAAAQGSAAGGGTAGSSAAAGTAGSVAGAGAPVAGDQAVTGSDDSAAGTTCAPQATSEVGITDTTITLGQVASLSGPIPGLGETGVAGARAHLAYRNSLGGVCGRTIDLSVGDDRFDTGENRAATARFAQETFALVGGWSAVDDGGAGALAGTDVPDVGLAISDARAALPNNFSSNPITQGQSGALPILRHMQSAYQLDSAAVVWAASPVPRARAQGYARDLESLGIPVAIQTEVAIAETNYVSVAQQIENEGADLVITALEVSQISRLAQALRQVDYQPAVPFYGAQTYGAAFLDLAGPAAEGTIIGITHPIIEEADGNAPLQTFVEWYQRVNPGAPIDFFSFQGWVAAAMLLDALAQAGPAPTRADVLAVLRTYTAYDAGGLVAPFDPAGKRNSECYMIVTVAGGRWQRVHPAGGGFACG